MIEKKAAKILARAIKKADPIIIAKHQHPDWDADGSAFGLAYLLKASYPRKKIYVVGDRLTKNKDFEPGTAWESKQVYPSTTLLITVDTANLERLDFKGFADMPHTIKIDHHPDTDPYAQYNLVDDSAIACAQMIVQLAQILKWKWTPEAANYLYKGILTDSGRFLHAKTNAETFEAAAFVNKKGVNFQKVNDELYVDCLKNRQWWNYAFNKMTISQQGVASLVLLPSDYEDRKLNYEQIKSALSIMSGIEEIKIWVLVVEWKNDLKVSLRSRKYDVASIAQKYHGGGHKLAAGAKLETLENVTTLVNDLNSLIVQTDTQSKKTIHQPQENKESKKHGTS
ncbi:phosphoesterase RecJ-like protein [Entomoplasma freundtii]|uniref:DHH family protein n=1 Tax=Entomoplasma freundtii TaxID=74700 RepID=A0A2K8NRF4_9MOLU|nr:bifunctional oligoribonuclease/PAP phosphatase NrnA [Entomoplasma freundtii]ATZ16116.1 DHH family protein [Entomoplasma freundtii]TDY56983.1 phosphoesterase RecJ-like protein [Entomoplasma freundtii]